MAALRKYRMVPVEGNVSMGDWQALCDRFDRRCVQCGKGEPEIKLTPDHVVPVAHGGAHAIDNLQPLCLACNRRKSGRHFDFRDRPFLDELKPYSPKDKKPRKKQDSKDLRQSLPLTRAEWAALDQIAAETRSLATTSSRAGRPSWRTLLRRIAVGELVVREAADGTQEG